MSIAKPHVDGEYGKWTVVGGPVPTDKGESKWLCRCACGTERYVLARSLMYGGSFSCGCTRKKRRPRDLSGEAAPQTGYRDISGQRFARLTALYPIPSRQKRSVVWHCRCDCGNELDVSYNELAYTTRQSCGCKKREYDARLKENLTRVDGTSIDQLRSRKISKNNTTGVKGVYLIRGRYVAKIVFQHKQYFLGTYANISDAAQARREAEETLAQGTVRYYERWRQLAEKSPDWARENPMHIFVGRDPAGRVTVSFLPRVDDSIQTTGGRDE